MWVIGLVVLALSVEALVRLDPLVTTPAGLIRGLRADDGEYSMFLGIPYAQVESDNPFGTSIPQPAFEAVFDAVDDSKICPQLNEFDNAVSGTLDCLRVNVYVPDKASSRNTLPVLVRIHGGAFTNGFSNKFIYGPKYLVRHDVILVTLNYRVGPYGFFCLDTPEIPGNQGLKDQLLALRWIKDNLASFGGDVNKITVMGESAGSSSIEYHLLSPQEQLFHQVIMQSGNTLLADFIDEPAQQPLRIAEELGFKTEDVSEAITFLTNTDIKSVIEAATKLQLRYRACVEKEFDDVESILTDHPLNLVTPKIRNTSVLIGFNNKEHMASFINLPDALFKNLNVFEDALKLKFNYDEVKDTKDILRRFYIGDEEMSEALRWQLIDFQSDYDFIFPIQLSLKKFLENGAKGIYYYVFSYSGGRNFVKKRLNITAPGAAHADELGYIFDLAYETDAPAAGDQKMIDQMTTLWTNFAKYGNPTPETSELLPVKWSPISEQVYTYLNIDSELSVSSRPYHERMAFWELFFEVNQKKLKGYHEN